MPHTSEWLTQRLEEETAVIHLLRYFPPPPNFMGFSRVMITSFPPCRLVLEPNLEEVMTPLYYNEEEIYLARARCLIKAGTGHCWILQVWAAGISSQQRANGAVWQVQSGYQFSEINSDMLGEQLRGFQAWNRFSRWRDEARQEKRRKKG